MIDYKLKELTIFIDEIEQIKPIDFLSKNIKTLDKQCNNLPEKQIILGKEFLEELKILIKKYKTKGLYNTVNIIYIYDFLINYLKMEIIKSKAASLGINKSMYKKEMEFLFKGKN